MEALRVANLAPKKIRVLDGSSEILSELLDHYAVHNNWQIGIQ